MPDLPRMPPGRRLFARIDRFECACPACGQLIFADLDRKHLPKRMSDVSRARAAAKQRPTCESVSKLFWNPHTQRLCCPWCGRIYTVGVVIYPVQHRGRRVTTAAPDIVPTPEEVAEMRRLGGGWFVTGGKAAGAYANLHVTDECRCPHLGTAPSCPLHGEEVLGRPVPVKLPRSPYASEYVRAAEAEKAAAKGGESE